jgi:putative glutamine amidotransferase
MPLPLIGVTTSRQPNRKGYPIISVMEAYVRALQRAGAAPVLIPMGLPQEALQAVLARLDGLLLTGGGDIHPERYGGAPHPQVEAVDAERDETELGIARRVAQSRLPFFGICRGAQVLNVALGGTIYEHILDQFPGALDHASPDERPRGFLAHPIRIDEGSRLADIIGSDSAQVNSLHHQAIRQLAPGLRAIAFAPDGVVEAVELPGHPFGLAVQWHPEWLQDHPPMQDLFRAFVQAAGMKSDEG